jgi:hypothetical protein
MGNSRGAGLSTSRDYAVLAPYLMVVDDFFVSPTYETHRSLIDPLWPLME